MATFNNGESGSSVRAKINAVLQHADGTSGELVINDAGADVEFRIESDTDPNAFFLDGATGNVGIGTSSPVGRLTIQGAAGTSGINQGIGLLYSNSTQFGALGLNNSSGWPQLMARGGAGITFHVNSDLVTTGEAMRIDSSGNVGIGTSSPTTKLTAYNGTSRTLIRAASDLNFAGAYLGTATATNRGASLDLVTHVNVNDATSWRLSHAYDLAAGALVFSNTDVSATFDGLTYTERLRIDANGNLGLGVTPNAWFSSIKAIDINAAGSIAASTNAVEVYLNSYYDAGGTFRYRNTGVATKYEQSLGAHKWYNAPSGTAGNAITFTQAMTLDSSGNVGIGTSSPGARLHAQSDLGGVSEGLRLQNDFTFATAGRGTQITFRGTSGGLLAAISGAASTTADNQGSLTYSANGATGFHSFTTNSTERLRIDSSGNLLIGTSTSGGSKLRISGLPTSSAGLSAGDVWNDGGTLKIV